MGFELDATRGTATAIAAAGAAVEAVRNAPDLNSAIDATYIRGLAQVGERMVILLDIESMLMSPDMCLVD